MVFKHFLKGALLLALVVVLLGAYTRLADAGLGCPDWPGCYGQLGVPNVADGTIIQGYERPVEVAKGWAEMIHRYAAGILGLVIFAVLVLVAKGRVQYRQTLALPSFLAFFVILQALFGMWTVTLKVHPGIVTTHLLGGFATTSMIFWLLLNQSRPIFGYTHILKRHKIYLLLVLLLIIVQILLGGWTSTNYAALSCGAEFPTCQGLLWPNMDFSKALYWGPLGVDYEFGVLENPVRVAIQMMHRIGALVVSVSLVFLFFIFKSYSHLKTNLLFIGALLILQLILGVLNLVLSLPMSIAVLHNGVALLLLLSIIALIHKSYQKPI